MSEQFEYDFGSASTRTSLKDDPKHNVWFSHEYAEPSLLVHEPPLTRNTQPDGTGLTHWSPEELAKHILVCQEALCQLDFYKTAEEERRYDAYVQTLEQDEEMDRGDDL